MKKQRAQFSAKQRQKLLEDFQQSDLTVTEFARQNGLSRPLLSIWLHRYVRGARAGAQPSAAASAVPMQEVKIGAVLGQACWAAEVSLPNGLTVRLDAPGRAQLMEELLRRC